MEPDKPVNPYQSPSVDVVSASPEANAEFIDGGRAVPAGNGLTWIGTGWSIFTQSPIAWIVCAVIMIVISIVLGFIPILGNLIAYILFAVFVGGLMLGCEKQRAGRPLEIGDLFSGFQEKAGPLIIVGVLFIAASLVLLLVAAVLFMMFLGSAGILGALMSGNAESLSSLMGGGTILAVLVIGLVILGLYVPIAMAFWFAPCLVALQNVAPVAALRMSFFACLKNFVPFLLYGVVFLVIIIIAALPFGLGLLVALPLVYASTYAAYRDIFLAE
jgi:uncharacterized membrane protein